MHKQKDSKEVESKPELYTLLGVVTMVQLTEQEIKDKGFQDKLQFGTRVEAKGVKGIVNHCSRWMCRVYYGVGKYIEVKPTECRILTTKEAVYV